MARNWPSLEVHLRYDVRRAWELDRGEFASDVNLRSLETRKGVFDLDGKLRVVAKGAELLSFGENLLASHCVDDEGNDDADPGFKVS